MYTVNVYVTILYVTILKFSLSATVHQQESPLISLYPTSSMSPQHEAPPPSQQSLQTHTPPLPQMSQTPLQTYPTLPPMDQAQPFSSLQPATTSSTALNQTQQLLWQETPHSSGANLTPPSNIQLQGGGLEGAVVAAVDHVCVYVCVCVRVCVRACVRGCVRAWVRACVRACGCVKF